MTVLARRLEKHFAVCAAAAAGVALFGAPKADAAVVHNVVNLPIPVTTNGLYLNVVTGAYNTTGGGGSTVPGGWTINPFGTTTLNMFTSTGTASHTNQNVLRTGGGGVANLAVGDSIGPAPIYGGFGTSSATATTGNQPWNLNSSNNLYGFRFIIAGNTHYGWARISLGSAFNHASRTLVEYAYEDQAGVAIGAGVPAPGALALLGLAGLLGSRRRRA